MEQDTTPTGRDDELPYSTDEWGRPNDRNYHYRIPLDNDRASRKLRVADKIMGRWFTEEWNVYDGYISVQTRDKKGHLPGLSTFVYSKEWRDFPEGAPRRFSGLEMKNGRKGGTHIRGSVYAGFTCYGVEIGYADVDFTVGATPSEIRAAYDGGEDYDEVDGEIAEALHYHLDDRYEEINESIAAELEADGVDLETFCW